MTSPTKPLALDTYAPPAFLSTFELDDGWASRTRQRAMRQLRRVPAFEKALKLRYLVARGRYVPSLASLSPPLQEALDELNRKGIVKRAFASLGVPSDDALEAAYEHVATLRARQVGDKATSELLSVPDLVSKPEPYLWGLQPAILDFVERYLGLPAVYLGVDVKREVANSVEGGVRVWHFDVEDERMVKFIVYLSDVDEGSGPFEAFDVPSSRGLQEKARHVWGTSYVHAQLDPLVPLSALYRGTGPKETVHVIDPVNILHRASPPTATDRYSMTFSYASRNAYFSYGSVRVAQTAFLAKWRSLLSERQLRATQ